MATDNDVVVVGGGVAALTAATFASRLGLRTTCVSDILVGGQIVNVGEIVNYPGLVEPVSGTELASAIEQQARDAGAEFVFGEALELVASDDGYTVTTTEGSISTRTAIVATGSVLRRLGIPGEDRLEGRGVSYCGDCDGPLFSGRQVIVIGGGDSAADEALMIAEHASEVLIVLRDAELRAAAATVARLESHERISIRPNCEPLEILGESTVSGLRVRDTVGGAEDVLAAAGIFVFVGLDPITSLLAGLADVDEHGRVETDAWMATRAPGVFAAGDIRKDSPGHLVNVASDGATAAIAAHRYLARVLETTAGR